MGFGLHCKDNSTDHAFDIFHHIIIPKEFDFIAFRFKLVCSTSTAFFLYQVCFKNRTLERIPYCPSMRRIVFGITNTKPDEWLIVRSFLPTLLSSFPPLPSPAIPFPGERSFLPCAF